MKQTFLVLSLTLSFAITAAAQSRTSKEIDGLVGPVHTVTSTHFTLTRTGESWTEGPHRTSVMTYDEQGNDGRFGRDDPVSGADCLQKRDDKGQVIEFECAGPTPGTTMKWFFTYDAAGHKVEDAQRDGTGKLIRRNSQSFDEKGNMTSLSSFDSEDKLHRKLTWTFDKKGNQTEFTESLLRNGEMVLFQRIISTYDDRRNILTQTNYGNPEGRVSTQFFSYELDARGNWIRRESSTVPFDSRDLSSKEVDIRFITYYEK